MSHLSPPSADAALSCASPAPPHLLRRKRSSANAALTSRPSILTLKTAASNDSSAAAQSEGGGAVTLDIEGGLAEMSLRVDGTSTEEFPSLQKLIFAHLLVTGPEDPAAAVSPDSVATCQVHWALFQPDLLITSSGAVYKLGRDEWTAMRDPIERLRGLIKSSPGQSSLPPPPPAPPSSPTGEQDLSHSPSEALLLGKTPLALAPPRRSYRTSTAARSIFEGAQASWLVLPPADTLGITSTRKVADFITFVARYPAKEGAKAEAGSAAAESFGAAPNQVEEVLKLDPQALAGQAQCTPDDDEVKEIMLRRLLDLFKV